VPILARFAAERPGVAVELAAVDRVLSLPRREADVAVRLQAPEESALVGRRVCELGSGLYAADRYLARHGRPPRGALRGHRLVGDAGATAESREERWLSASAEGACFAFRSESTFARRAAIAAGVGVGVLAGYLARRSEGLQRLWPEEPAPARELWLVMRPELRRDRTVRALLTALLDGLARVRGELARS
jgi:DNA-binding transcriptional LysR family regulator